MTTKVFISYATPDKKKVKSVLEKLRKSREVGLDLVIIDVQMPALGKDVRAEIKRSIKEADQVVIVWTKQSAESSFVNYEAGMAEALGKPITVVMPESGAPKLPSSLQGVRILEFGT